MSGAAQDSRARLAVVDGWRAVAVLGVIWWHAWIHTGNPPVTLHAGAFAVNLQRCFAVLGNGVHLFFVLSGFCICLSLEKRGRALEAAGYLRFVANRWRRLSPAFYAISLATAAALAIAGERAVSTADLAAHLTWLFGIWPGVEAFAPSYWSLQVEWEFYLLAPLLLIAFRPARKFAVVSVLLLGSLVWRYLAHHTSDGIPLSGGAHLPLHFTAFFCGIVSAEGWRQQSPWFQRLRGWPVFLVGALVAYAGRGISTTEAFQYFGALGVLAKTLGQPIMVLGFATMLAATLNGVSGVGTFLSTFPMQWIGRHSYSLYLWHWWPCVWIGHALRTRYGSSAGAHYATLGATLLVCAPLAWLTYRFLEAPYFRRKPISK